MDIDWKLLREQKEWLLGQDGPEAAGLVNLIDAIQDEAEGIGVPANTIYGEDTGESA